MTDAQKLLNNQKFLSVVLICICLYIDSNCFAGFYNFFLPERCWDSRGTKVIVEENWGSRRAVSITDTDAKKVRKVEEKVKQGAWSVLDVSHDLIVAQYSAPNTPPQLVRACL